MSEIPNSGKQEQEDIAFLTLLRQALDEKNVDLLGSVLKGIQRAVEGAGLHASPMREWEIKELIRTGKGTIPIASGSLGERIYIENGKLTMPTGYEVRDYSRSYHNNFRSIFHLDQLDPDEEMSVDF